MTVVDMQDWRGRALRAERELAKERVSAENLRALKASNEQLLDDMTRMLRSFCAAEEVYYGGGQYSHAPVMTRHEIEQACRQFLRDRVL